MGTFSLEVIRYSWKHVPKEKWDKLKDIETKTCGFTLAKAIACAVEFDNQHCGIYAGDWDFYKDFANVFDPLIQEYHGISADAKHTSDMDPEKVVGNINPEVPVHSTRIRVGRNIDGFGLSPGITKQQRIDIEKLMSSALSKLTDDLAGTYYPLTGMDEAVRQQLVDDHFLFMSGDRNLQVAGMERDWPEGRGIFHNEAKTFLLWVNEEDQTRIISMEKGGDVKGVFSRLARGIKAVGDSVKAESGKDFALDERYGYIHSCHKRYLGRRDIVLRTLNIFLLIRRGEREGGSCTLLSSVERSWSVGVLIKGLWLIDFTHYSIRHNNTFLQNNK